MAAKSFAEHQADLMDEPQEEDEGADPAEHAMEALGKALEAKDWKAAAAAFADAKTLCEGDDSDDDEPHKGLAIAVMPHPGR